MTEKVTFNGANKLITVSSGEVSINAEAHLYSAAKRQWKDDATLNKLKLPFRVIGGDPLGGALTAGAYFFLQNQAGRDWRIRPYEGDHELTIVGNLYAEDASLPIFVSTLGDYTVTIRLETSSLTQSVEELQTQLTEVEAQTTNIELHRIGRVKLEGDQLIVYDTNNQEIARYTLVKDEQGRIIERVPQ